MYSIYDLIYKDKYKMTGKVGNMHCTVELKRKDNKREGYQTLNPNPNARNWNYYFQSISSKPQTETCFVNRHDHVQCIYVVCIHNYSI